MISTWSELDEKHKQVTRGADPGWMQAAEQGIRQLASSRGGFTADDVRDWLEAHAPGVETGDTRALGALMQRLQRTGVVTNTGRYVKSRYRRSPVPVWAAS